MSKSGTSAIFENLRKKIPIQGALDQGESLSSMMSNVSLSSFTRPIDGVVVASFKIASTEPTIESITKGIQKLFGGELGVVKGSIKVLEKGRFFTSVSAHLVRNRVTRPVGDEIPQGFISLSKNIFMEERDAKTWKLITTDGGKKVLVRDNSVETDEDIEDLLSSLASVNHVYSNEAKKLMACASSLVSNLKTGVLVSFVQGQDQRLGFIVEEIDHRGKVGIATAKGYVSVSANKVVHAFDLEEYYGQLALPKVETLSARVDVNVMVDYYKKLFAYNKDYLQKVLERVKTNAVV